MFRKKALLCGAVFLLVLGIGHYALANAELEYSQISNGSGYTNTGTLEVQDSISILDVTPRQSSSRFSIVALMDEVSSSTITTVSDWYIYE